MPRHILPHLSTLSMQINGIINYYIRLLDDEFLFGSAGQVPQVATIFDQVIKHRLYFGGEYVALTDLLTLIAYRYGLTTAKIMGHGGYALVLGHPQANPSVGETQHRVMRMVPEHHVRDVTGEADIFREFDVQLTDDGTPIRDPDYPLLLSDLLLMPRHTTRLIFHNANGRPLLAAGYPAMMHCQLLPEVRAFNQLKADRGKVKQSGDLLEAALATLGVSVADAHGGNGGVLIGGDGGPVTFQPTEDDEPIFIPIVLDYGYYSQISPKQLADILVRHGVDAAIIKARVPNFTYNPDEPLKDQLRQVIAASERPRAYFGRWLYHLDPPLIDPTMWINRSKQHWETVKERTYPALREQSRLSRLYPDYDEVVFPQRIESYTFTI